MTLEVHCDQQARINMLANSQKPCPEKTIKCKRLSDKGTLPTRAHKYDAGWDLYSSENLQIVSNHRRTVSTSIALSIPDGYVGLIWPRSGLAVKRGIDVFAGVIDAGYRGEIKIRMSIPHLGAPHYKVGDRVAQLIVMKLSWVDVTEIKDLDDSERGSGGFGSSGE